jgi:hypothetical protein
MRAATAQLRLGGMCGAGLSRPRDQGCCCGPSPAEAFIQKKNDGEAKRGTWASRGCGRLRFHSLKNTFKNDGEAKRGSCAFIGACVL